jgi:hypothetical protein
MTTERAVLVILGIASIVWGLKARQFYPGVLGMGHRSRTIPKWVGRTWSVLVGLGFIYMGFRGGLPLPLEKIIAVSLGIAIIVFGIMDAKTKARRARDSNGRDLGVPFFKCLWPIAAGIFCIFVGLTLKR